MKLVIKVRASAVNRDPRKNISLADLDGVTSDECFCDYLSDGGDDRLAKLNIQGGKLRLEYSIKDEALWSIVEYSVTEKLNSTAEQALIEYTLGQLTDGIGDNLAQEYVDKKGILIKPKAISTEIEVDYFQS